MDSGDPLTPSVNATHPILFSHFMGTNLSMLPSDMKNHDTQSIPWASNHFSHSMPDMCSHLPSFPSPSYMNPSFGSRGMMPPFSKFSFDGSYTPQPNLTVGGWNIPSHRSNHSFTFLGQSTQMGSYSNYYTQSIYPSSNVPVPTNSFTMADPHLSSGISYRGSQIYSTGYPLHGFPSSGGNLYPHLSNPCHDVFSSKTSSSVMMPLQHFMNQFGGGYYPTR
jgi:hypothetical protein